MQGKGVIATTVTDISQWQQNGKISHTTDNKNSKTACLHLKSQLQIPGKVYFNIHCHWLAV
jgi:hypothetical protein